MVDIGDSEGFWKKALPYIKPNLRGEAGPSLKLPPADAPVSRALNDDLLVLYLVDEGDRFSYVQGRHLPEGVDEQELFRTAIANLEEYVEGKIRVHRAGEVFAVILDGNFEASLLLLDWLWAHSLREYAPSGPVVVVPSRDVLAFCDRNHSAGLEELAAVVSRVFPLGDHTISQNYFQLSPSGWIRHDA